MIVLLAVAQLGLADEISATSSVDAVTVYANQARVTRTATLRVPEGRSDVVFEDLPLNLDAASLSASGEGAATLLGVDARTVRGVADRDAVMEALRREAEARHDDVVVQEQIVARVRADEAFLTALNPTAPGVLDRDLFLVRGAPAELAAFSRTIGTQTRALLVERRAAEREIRDLNKELTRLRAEIARIGSQTRDANRVVVGLQASRAGTVTVHLSYLVRGASWTPRYDARYDVTGDEVRLDLSGVVQQSTGETWDGARLTLSAAPANHGTAPPDLTPFTLGVGGSGRRRSPASARAASTATFDVSRPVTVPSDGVAHQVPVASVTVAATTVHRVVARRAPAAYLTARVENGGDWAWLPGPVNSYLGSAFVGRGTLGLTAPGQEASLSFGVDDRVSVERVPLDNVSVGSRVLSSRVGRSYGFETRITNGTGQPVDVVVVDQVPTSREARFEVEAKTSPTVAVPKDGVFEWTQTLSPSERGVFRLEYDVSWPEGEAPQLLD